MKTKLLSITFIIITFLFNSCDNHQNNIVANYDTTPPLPPVGIYAIALDNAVGLNWIPNQETDLSGYKIYVSSSYNGRYEFIGVSSRASFTDNGVRNGNKYYYAITAYDYTGNESELSKDVIYSTPRPEGYNVFLQDRFINPNYAGYDFSAYQILNYNTDFTDIYLEFTQNGVPYFVVWNDTQIQDMGYTKDLDEISTSPTQGWSPTKDAHIIIGHTYVIRTWDNHYAKVRVTDIQNSSVKFDWAYQLVQGDTHLIAPRKNIGRNRGTEHIIKSN